MLLSRWNINGQNRPILPPPWVSAAMYRHRPPAMVKKLPMIILPSSSGSRRLVPYHLQKAATATSIEKLNAASIVISQLVGSVVPKKVSWKCWSAQTR